MDPSIIMYILAVLLGIVSVVFFASKKKTTLGMNKFIPGVFFLVLAVFLVAWQVGWLTQSIGLAPLSAGVFQETPTGGENLPPVGELCAIEDTTVTLSATDVYTSIATGGTHAYKVNGNPKKTVADAGTFTASPGNVIQYLLYNASGTSFFSELGTAVVPCKGTYEITGKLYGNSSATFTVFNSEGNAMGIASTETLGAGDIVTLDAELKGQYKKGSPHGEVVVCYYNKTSVDDCIVNFGGNEVEVPSLVAIATGYTAKAYTVPPLLSTDKLIGSVTIDADDTIDPIPIDSNLTLYLYANNYFFNENTGGSFDGPAVEDENNVKTNTLYTAYTVGVG